MNTTSSPRTPNAGGHQLLRRGAGTLTLSVVFTHGRARHVEGDHTPEPLRDVQVGWWNTATRCLTNRLRVYF